MVEKKKGGKKQQLGTTSTASIHSRSQLMAKSGSRLHSQSRHRLSKQISGENNDEWLQAKDPVKPPDQLDLPEEVLNEELTRILRADNPNAPHNIVRFSYKDGAYKQMASVDQCAFHFTLNGTLIHKESDEARRQLARNRYKGKGSKADATKTEEEEGESGEKKKTAEAGTDTAAEEKKKPEEGEDQEKTDAGAGEGEEGKEEGEGEEGEEDEEEDDDEEEEGGGAGDDKPLRNQFNFSERAAQCFAPAHRDRETMTEAPQRETFSGNVTQWSIFDAYVADQEKQQAAKTKRRSSAAKAEQKTLSAAINRELGDDSGSDWQNAARLIDLSTAKKMERLVNQNMFHEVAMDFKYWDDPSDQFKEKQGSLLPLWRFSNEKTKKKHVTSLRWCHEYPDLVLVGFGSYDYTKQSGGAICAYSLKNPSYPEYIITTNSGVMCIDIHPKQASLLAVGLYDGSVAVFDLSRKTNRDAPLVRSTAKTGKHTDPVWSVEWHEDDVDQNRNFSSVSSDGRVSTWTMVQTELQHTDIIRLSFDTTNTPGTGQADTTDPLFGLGAGTCLNFNRHRENVFLIGTEEGNIHQCSRAYTSKFLKTFKAHTMAVYSVVWNPFHPRVFASCSADWTVKIWDDHDDQPVFTFDLGNAVGSVAWSPYSSCVFAAVTTDGKVHVFDLQQNKYEPICQQQVTKKAKLTQITFNVKNPIIIVGDDRGAASTFKLSPNLRKALMEKKQRTEEDQIAFLDRLLESVKETPHIPAAPEEAT